jgi:5-methylcytosine-specific restriction endonuclease McrA
MTHRRCTKCLASKSLSDFPVEKRNRCGVASECFDCKRARGRLSAKRRRAALAHDPEYRAKKRAGDKAYYRKNKDRCIARARVWEAQNRDKPSLKDGRRQTHKRYRDRNPDKRRDYDRGYRAVKRDELNAKERERYASNPTTRLALIAKRRVREMGADGAGVSATEWREIQEVFGYRCAYCLQKPARLYMDHVDPLIRGGEHSPSNLVPACGSCNSSKRDHTLLGIVTRPHLVVYQRMFMLTG